MFGYGQSEEKQKQTAERLRQAEEHALRSRRFQKDKSAVIRRHDRRAHDFPHHFEAVAAMDNVEDIHKYIGRILQLDTTIMKITGNDDIDCILWPKQQRAEEKGISFHVSGLLPEHMDFLDRYDIVTIIGNGLSNAIDACEKIAGSNKFISISFRFDHNLCIQIDNPFVEAEGKTNWFKSTKKEPGHGFGMENMREAVDKYHGYMDPVVENGIFSLRIMLQQIR